MTSALPAGFDIKICTVSQDTLKFVVQVPHNTWLGIGFGPGMSNVDMVRFVGSKTAPLYVEDLFSSGFK